MSTLNKVLDQRVGEAARELYEKLDRSTRCPNCQELLVERFGYRITDYRLKPGGSIGGGCGSPGE